MKSVPKVHDGILDQMGKNTTTSETEQPMYVLAAPNFTFLQEHCLSSVRHEMVKEENLDFE